MSVYSDGERRAAVALAVEVGGAAAARRLGVARSTIYRWAARAQVSLNPGRQPCDEGVASSTTADGPTLPAERPR